MITCRVAIDQLASIKDAMKIPRQGRRGISNLDAQLNLTILAALLTATALLAARVSAGRLVGRPVGRPAAARSVSHYPSCR